MILSVIECDICCARIAYMHYGKSPIITWARKKGWSVGKTIIKCPKCKTKVNK